MEHARLGVRRRDELREKDVEGDAWEHRRGQWGVITPELVAVRKCCDIALVNMEEGWMGRDGEVGNVGEPGFERVWVASYLFLEREDGGATLHGLWHLFGQLLLKMICVLTGVRVSCARAATATGLLIVNILNVLYRSS